MLLSEACPLALSARLLGMGLGGAPRQIRASAGKQPQYPTSSPPGILVASIELIARIEDSSCPETMRAHIERIRRAAS